MSRARDCYITSPPRPVSSTQLLRPSIDRSNPFAPPDPSEEEQDSLVLSTEPNPPQHPHSRPTNRRKQNQKYEAPAPRLHPRPTSSPNNRQLPRPKRRLRRQQRMLPRLPRRRLPHRRLRLQVHLVNFGCSRPPSPGPVTYASPDCTFGLGDVPDETAKSRATCETVGGTLCRHTYRFEPKFVNNCIVSTADVGAFQTGCEAVGGTFREGNRGLSFAILTNNCKAE